MLVNWIQSGYRRTISEPLGNPPHLAPGGAGGGRLLARGLDVRLVAIGALGGLLSGLLGVGGGIVMVPLLVLWAGYGQRDAHAASLGAIIPISCASVLTYGVVALPGHMLRLVFAAFLALVAVRLVRDSLVSR